MRSPATPPALVENVLPVSTSRWPVVCIGRWTIEPPVSLTNVAPISGGNGQQLAAPGNRNPGRCLSKVVAVPRGVRGDRETFRWGWRSFQSMTRAVTAEAATGPPSEVNRAGVDQLPCVPIREIRTVSAPPSTCCRPGSAPPGRSSRCSRRWRDTTWIEQPRAHPYRYCRHTPVVGLDHQLLAPWRGAELKRPRRRPGRTLEPAGAAQGGHGVVPGSGDAHGVVGSGHRAACFPVRRRETSSSPRRLPPEASCRCTSRRRRRPPETCPHRAATTKNHPAPQTNVVRPNLFHAR